jgi:branched-subunit amino acid aminotransferase/4-amino-4-deoxychorismate lyase
VGALCAATGIPAAARGLTIAELRAADELFVTSSVRGVVPVTALDDAPRVPGPVTARLAAAYVDEMSALAEASRHDLLL